MSARLRNPGRIAPLFAALGDETRLALVARLSAGEDLSVTGLTAGSGITRQAVSKHLRVLAGAGLVRSSRRGREQRWRLEPSRLHDARRSLEHISRQWDESLGRLRAMVED
jgi:DNA-binding transcriptional ArsR family regulator